MNDETRKRLGEAIKAGDDPYVYPGTHVLRNKLGITDLSAWSKQEADFCWHRILEYQAIPRGPGADPPRLKTIHRLIFRDCYEWAGKFRTIDIAKGADSFLPPNSLESNATRIFGHLAQENHLKKLGLDKFIERLSTYFSSINNLHPFREGNGRAQEIFFAQLAEDAGYRLDWSTVSRDDMLSASIASHDGDLDPLRKMFTAAVTPIERAKTTESTRRFSIER